MRRGSRPRKPMAIWRGTAARRLGGAPEAALQSFTLMKVVGRDIWIGIWAFVLAIVATSRWDREPSAASDEASARAQRDGPSAGDSDADPLRQTPPTAGSRGAAAVASSDALAGVPAGAQAFQARTGAGEIWERFPKFVLGFVVASGARDLDREPLHARRLPRGAHAGLRCADHGFADLGVHLLLLQHRPDDALRPPRLDGDQAVPRVHGRRAGQYRARLCALGARVRRILGGLGQ